MGITAGGATMRAVVGPQRFSPHLQVVANWVVVHPDPGSIVRRLTISEKTVKSHLTRVFAALGVSDRTSAALWAQRNGLL